MTKKAWVKHIMDISGLTPPSRGGRRLGWFDAIRRHNANQPDCPDCKARNKTKRANANRQEYDQLRRDMGLKKVKGSAGGTFWEDVYKYGTKEEIEFLLEALSPAGDFISTRSQFREKMGKNPALAKKYEKELQIIEDAMSGPSNSKSTNLQNWVIKNKEEAKRISDLFKSEIQGRGNINRGAFSGL